MIAFPKNHPLEFPELRKAADGAPCTINAPCCDYNPETTVLCHLRSLDNNAGMRLKPDDTAAVLGCVHCHNWIDERVDLGPEIDCDREWYKFRAYQRTVRYWVTQGVFTVTRGKR